MSTILRRVGVVVLVGIFWVGCSSKGNSPGDSETFGYFKTQWQDESQFIVENILADIVEMASFAKNKSLPVPKTFLVAATETAGSAFRAPIYDVRITLQKNKAPIQFLLPIKGSIWSPEVYASATKSIFIALNMDYGRDQQGADDSVLLSELTDATALTIERLNQTLSAELQGNFRNPTAHEKAAALLGAFTLREASGSFFDQRLPLCRMTAHLAFAQALTDHAAPSTVGTIAQIMLSTATGNEEDALQKLEKFQAKTSAQESWQRVLRAVNTGDYRPLANAKNPSPIERIAWFSATATSANLNLVWEQLTPKDLELPNFVRIANSSGYSVQTGHMLSRLSLRQEKKEIAEIYASSHGKELKDQELVDALNELPERCFTMEKSKPKVRIIGWGQWAMFLQRHLCHSIHQTYYFINQKIGLKDEAQEFADQIEEKFSDLRLYPFVRRFTAAEEISYHKSVDDGFAVTVATPHLVSGEVWNYLCWKPSYAALYAPNSNPHVNEWHKHNPPPGTAYNMSPRMNHPSLVNREDTAALLAQLHAIAPHNQTIARRYTDQKYKEEKATYDQLVEIYGPVLDYNPYPMLLCANAIKDRPEKYEVLMLKVCELNPARYIEMADYFYDQTNLTKAIYYAEKRFELDPDKVGVSHRLGWMISYYLDKGDRQRAEELADFGGEVYSSGGLLAKAGFYEQTEQYQSAFEWYEKNEERYDQWRPLVDFCTRYRTKTGDDRFQPELEKRVKKIFTKGLRKVTLANFSTPPKFAVSINEDNDLLREAGLRKGDIIVAIDGISVNGIKQYTYIRDGNDSSQLDLIIWDGNKFREVHASPPNRRFNANFGDYRAE